MKNTEWTKETERAAQRLLAKLRAEPLAKEREELGRMLMRHIDSFSPDERKRYDELKSILIENSTATKNRSNETGT